MTGRLRLLDLCCGAGGASAGYHAAGFDVVGVDIDPQPDYPFRFIHADALTVDLSGYDVIAASPPCQRFSTATPAHLRHTHPDLIDPIRRRLRDAVARPGGPYAYVIENVPGAPLVDPVVLCGDTLRLGVRRHRLFESNLPLVGTRCHHDRAAPTIAVYGSYGQRTGRRNPIDVDGEPSPTTDQARTAMGIDWMPWPALTQAIPPAYTHWLGVQLAAHARDATAAGVASPRDGSTQGATVTRDASALDHTPGDVTPPASTGIRHCRCGRPLPARPTTGRWPRYCSHACRQAAYRHRKADP